jgi:hypothetical protein
MPLYTVVVKSINMVPHEVETDTPEDAIKAVASLMESCDSVLSSGTSDEEMLPDSYWDVMDENGDIVSLPGNRL